VQQTYLEKIVRVGGKKENLIKINRSYWFMKNIIPKELRKHIIMRPTPEKLPEF
jgi:hypothetical protein